MHFTEKTIRDLDGTEFSSDEKKYLLDKFFPRPPTTPLQQQLRSILDNAKRWERYFQQSEEPDALQCYRYTHSQLVDTARSPSRQRIVGNRVTDFTSWVYSLYLPHPKGSTLETGKHIEREIANKFEPTPEHDGWKLIFQDPLIERAQPFKISTLQVNGQVMWGTPDLVFRERKTGRVLIIERKATNASIPTDGWPNLRAQLWAYGHIDQWAEAPEVLLAGEIWGFGRSWVRIRHSFCWRLSDKRFCAENQELFDIYSSVNSSDLADERQVHA